MKADEKLYRLPPGTVLDDRYVLEDVLGEGGFGITYIGRDLSLDIKVAIKEYYPNATVLESLGISGSSIRNASSKTTVENWLKKLGVDKQSTSISNVRAKTNTANASYTLNGTRSNGQQRIYIRNGNKYIKR